MTKVTGGLLALLVAALAFAWREEQLASPCTTAARPDLAVDMPKASSWAEKWARKSMTPTQILAQCILAASSVYNVPSDVMIGIMSVEGGRMGQAVGPNVNGTYDLGIMQINSLWVPKLALLWHVDYGTAYSAVRDGGCENVYVGAWILKQSIVQTGALYSGIAYYHSATPGLGTPYANKVRAAMQRKGIQSSP